MKLLFASIHCFLDPSSGAALATRELLELLAARGFDCRAFPAGVHDYERETAIEARLDVLDLGGRAGPRRGARLRRGGSRLT
jgi:hypothetical protein